MFKELAYKPGWLFALTLIFGLSLAAYSNSFHAGFQLDDGHQISDNPSIRDISNAPRFFTDAALSADPYIPRRIYRPVTLIAFTLCYAVFGLDVFGYHLLNFVLHVVVSSLVFIVIRKVCEAGSADKTWLPLIAALVFALHPIQTGTVTYISSCSVLLASLFFLLSFYAFLRYRNGPDSGRAVWAALAPVLYMTGLFSKEMAVSLPVVMLVYDFIFTFPKMASLRGRLRAARFYLPFMAALLLFLVFKKSFQGSLGDDRATYSVYTYFISETKVLLMYVRLLFLPVNQNEVYNLPITRSVDLLVAVSLMLVAASLVFLYRIRRINPVAAFFGSWFFIVIAPESSLVPIMDIAFEHRLYLPSVGFIAALAMLASQVKFGSAKLKKAVALSIIALLPILTFNRNHVWATTNTMWDDVSRKNTGPDWAYYFEDIFVAHWNMGEYYLSIGEKERAIEQFKLVTGGKPPYTVPAYERLGDIYYGLERYREAAETFKAEADITPDDASVLYNLAVSEMHAGDLDAAETDMERALKFSSDDYGVRYNLALIYYKKGRHSEAVRHARAAARLSPGDSERAEAELLVAQLEGGG